MIAPNVVAEVRRLLSEGKLSQRKIAVLMGLSRGTVGAIATGKRPDYETLQAEHEDDPWEEAAGPPQRCPDCGGMVFLPCRLCRTLKALSTKPRHAASLMAEEFVALDLRPEHRARYEEVHRWRQENEGQPVLGAAS